ncbi:MAG: glycosyltransferase family 4 protein [Armatimonadota bacterium]
MPRFIRDLLRRVNNERFELHACTARPLLPEDDLAEIGNHVTFHPLNMPRDAGIGLQGRLMWELAHVVRKVRPDVLHAYTGIAWYAIPSDLLGRAVRGRLLDIHTGPDGGQLSRLNTASQRFMARRLGYRPVVHSTDTRDNVAKAFGLGADSIAMILTGIDTASFASPRTPRHVWRRRNQLSDDALVVLYMARVVPVKNVALFVEVARQVAATVDRAVFLVAGDGPERPALESAVRKEGLQNAIRFLGLRTDLVDLYHASDLFLSTSNYESFPLTILESMAAGLPVVATSVGGVVDQVQEGRTGRLCLPGDAGALIRATTELLRDAARRKQLGEAGQERARRLFDIGQMAEAYQHLYEALVHGESDHAASAHLDGSRVERA